MPFFFWFWVCADNNHHNRKEEVVAAVRLVWPECVSVVVQKVRITVPYRRMFPFELKRPPTLSELCDCMF